MSHIHTNILMCLKLLKSGTSLDENRGKMRKMSFDHVSNIADNVDHRISDGLPNRLFLQFPTLAMLGFPASEAGHTGSIHFSSAHWHTECMCITLRIIPNRHSNRCLSMGLVRLIR